MNSKKEEIDNLIKKLDEMIEREAPKKEIEVVIEKLNELLEDYLEE